MADANIFRQYLQPVKSVMDYGMDLDAADLRRQQLIGAERQNALAALVAQQQQAQMGEAAADRNALQRIASGWNAETAPDARIAALRNSGRPALMSQADTLEKQWLDRRKTEADVGKTSTETGETRRKALLQQASMLQTPDDALALINDGVKRQEIPEQMATLLGRMVTTDPQWKQNLMIGIGDPSQMAKLLQPHLQTVNAGNAQVQQMVDPRTGAVKETGRTQVFQDPNSVAQVAATMRGQNMTDARARDRLAFDQAGGASAVDVSAGSDPAQSALNRKFGKPEAGRRWKLDGTLEPIPGGSADRKTNEQTAGKETVDSVVASLRSSYDSLDQRGGITSTEKNPAQNVAAAVSRTGIGQAIGGALGTRNQKERDAIAQARPLLLQAIMKATGMSAKQMDSNAELKLYLATATDPTLTLEANREALDRIESLYGSGTASATPTNPRPTQKPGSPGIPRIQSDAEFNALPSGATFISPDGKTRRKP